MFFLAAVLLLSACGDESQRRGATVLFASGADLLSINPLLTDHPLARQVQRYVLLLTLARYDSTLTPHPYLARSWQWSEDGRALTFHLRTDVRWHDGVPTTARDVVWTLNAARDPATGYPRLSQLRGLTAVTAVNDSTVALRFASASPPRVQGFPAELGGPPLIEKLIVVVVDEPTIKLTALVAGELDFAGINPQHAAFVRRRDGLAVRDYPLIYPFGLVLNTRRPPFNDPRARLAAALAIDRQEIVDGYLFGYGVPATGPVPPDVPLYVPTPPVRLDADSARRLVASLEIPPQFELLTVGSGEAPLEQMLQARLNAVGFDVRIRQLASSAFQDYVSGSRHDFSAAVMGIPGDPGLGFLQRVGELTGVVVPADPKAAQQVLAEQLPVIWLYHARGVQGMNQRVQGVQMDVRGELPTVTAWHIRPSP